MGGKSSEVVMIPVEIVFKKPAFHVREKASLDDFIHGRVINSFRLKMQGIYLFAWLPNICKNQILSTYSLEPDLLGLSYAQTMDYQHCSPFTGPPPHT